MRPWFTARLNGSAAVGLPWSVLMSFVRIVANRRVYTQPVPVVEAWREVERWLDCPCVWIPQPMERHRQILGSLLAQVAYRPSLVSDAHLAALAIEHGLTLCSADGDFARFRGLRWENPLTEETPRK